MKRTAWLWLSLLSASVIVPACSGSGGSGETTSSSSSSSTGGSVPPDAMCDVLAVLRQQCWSCHGTTLHDSAPSSLVTLEHLKGPSIVDAAQTNAERAVLRMENSNSPMPPGAVTRATAEQIALFKAWIAAGYPTASCGDAAKDPYAAATKCSGEQLDLHQQEGEDMNAGRACNACHEQVNIEQGGDAPLFTLAGTIFPTAHEPDDCRAPSAEGAQVEITDAKGKVVVVEANEAGNFFYKEPDLTFPYTAKVIFEGRERAMARPQQNGACNQCHSAAGTEDAPGRILLP